MPCNGICYDDDYITVPTDAELEEDARQESIMISLRLAFAAQARDCVDEAKSLTPSQDAGGPIPPRAQSPPQPSIAVPQRPPTVEPPAVVLVSQQQHPIPQVPDSQAYERPQPASEGHHMPIVIMAVAQTPPTERALDRPRRQDRTTSPVPLDPGQAETGSAVRQTASARWVPYRKPRSSPPRERPASQLRHHSSSHLGFRIKGLSSSTSHRTE